MLRKPVILIFASVLLIGGIWGASYVHGQFLSNGPWPEGSVIKYYNNTDYDKTLTAAAYQWNRMDLPVSFKETNSKDSADLIIEQKTPEELNSEICGSPPCNGHADVGYNPVRSFFQGASFMYLLPPSSSLENKIQNESDIKTIIHEFGHILGLKHPEEGTCSVMNAGSICRNFSSKVVSHTGTDYLCGPWMEDAELVAELYQMEKRPNVESTCSDKVATTDFIRKMYLNNSDITRILKDVLKTAPSTMINDLRKLNDITPATVDNMNNK